MAMKIVTLMILLKMMEQMIIFDCHKLRYGGDFDDDSTLDTPQA